MNAAQLADLIVRLELYRTTCEWSDDAETDEQGTFITGTRVENFHDDMQAVIAELRALGGGWLPIESAPKDGTRVILDWDGKSINGFYLDNTWARIPYAGWRVEAMVVTPKGQPTHWQPLPPSPSATVEG